MLGATSSGISSREGWRELITGILVGVFGYALGTVAGTTVFNVGVDWFIDVDLTGFIESTKIMALT